MAKGVLGNDPFLRGAAPVGKSGEAPPAQGEPRGELAPTGAAPIIPKAQGPRSSGPAAEARRVGKPAGRATAQPGRASGGRREKGRGGRESDRAERATQAGSRKPGQAIPHASAPVLVGNVAGTSVPHPASPEMVGDVAGQAIPHADAPEWVAEAEGTPAQHAAADAASRDSWREPPPDLSATRRQPSPAEEIGSRVPSADDAGTLRSMVVHALQNPALGRGASAAVGLLRALATGLGLGRSVLLDDYGRDGGLVDAVQPISDFLYQRYWRVSVDGAERVPKGASILVGNHSGALPFDGFVLHLALTRERPELGESRWLVEDQIFHAPFVGPLINRLGAIRACPENAQRLLEEGRPVIVFPEGVQGMGKLFRERYQLKRFGRGGFVKLALRTRAPIVPVAVVGAEESLPLLAKLPGGLFGAPYIPITPLGPLPLPAKWTIRFGEPIDLAGLPPEAAEDPSEVQRLTERTRESIQGMITALLGERGSIF
ncbi:MAG: 1-acyl-sn-glycerol-3-phosphate acyltransferase [Myxococcales bacterium]|nr:1-acyl-sn-glycerol-3-phosphate acyltransferase [Myxococcales bacterium]